MHVGDRLQGHLAGTLTPAEREGVDAHLAACADCRVERDLLETSRDVIRPLAPVEPRAGFAAMVALNARDRRTPPLAAWLRWAVSGLALAGAAAVAVVVASPAPPDRAQEVRIAQRLDLLEDLPILQNQEALEDLDVVAELHTLEARP